MISPVVCGKGINRKLTCKCEVWLFDIPSILFVQWGVHMLFAVLSSEMLKIIEDQPCPDCIKGGSTCVSDVSA